MRYKYSIISAGIALTAIFCGHPGFAQVLDTADNFAVLGSSTVTNTGLTTVTGDVGVDPGSAITGFPPGIVTGTIYGAGAVTSQAQTDATAAYNGLVNMSSTGNLTGQDMGSLTLMPGVFTYNTSAQLTGPLVLNAEGLNNAYFVFQIGSTLTTASSSSVTLINPGSDDGIFWVVGTSATLGTGTSFMGNILADQSITLNTGADLNGRAIALNAAVTMDDNNSYNTSAQSPNGFDNGLTIGENGVVTPIGNPAVAPEPASIYLLGLGLIGFMRFRKNNIAY